MQAEAAAAKANLREMELARISVVQVWIKMSMPHLSRLYTTDRLVT